MQTNRGFLVVNVLFRLIGVSLIAVAIGADYRLDRLVNDGVDHPVTLFECLLVLAAAASGLVGLVLLMLGSHVLREASDKSAGRR